MEALKFFWVPKNGGETWTVAGAVRPFGSDPGAPWGNPPQTPWCRKMVWVVSDGIFQKNLSFVGFFFSFRVEYIIYYLYKYIYLYIAFGLFSPKRR